MQICTVLICSFLNSFSFGKAWQREKYYIVVTDNVSMPCILMKNAARRQVQNWPVFAFALKDSKQTARNMADQVRRML